MSVVILIAEESGSDVVGTVKEENGSWYAIARTERGEKKLCMKGDIFCSDINITHCLRIEDIKENVLTLRDVRSKSTFILRPGEKIPLEGTYMIFDKTVAADVIEYRYNNTPGSKKAQVEDFTIKSLEADKRKVVVEKDYDMSYLPEGLSDEEKELFASPKAAEEKQEKINADLFEQIQVEKIGQDTWAVNTEEADMALDNIGHSLLSVIKNVEPSYRFGEGPSLKFNSTLGDVIFNKEGFLVQNLAVGKIVERAGIRQGDLIKSINDQPVNSLYGIYKAYMNVRSDNNIRTVNVDIIRSGIQRTLTYKVR